MRSIINLDSINKNLSGLTESIKNAQKQSEQISDNVEKRNKAKKDGLVMSSKLFARRRDNTRRREKEDLLEASGVLGAFKASNKVIRRNTKGFLGRILDFVGTIIIGWSILNFPKIIKLAEGVMIRLKKFFGVLNLFVDRIKTFFTDLGSRFTQIVELLSRVNFEPFLNQVKNFMNKVSNSFTKITLNTVKTIQKYVGRTEREIAYDIGIGELYDKLAKGELPQPLGSGEESDESSDDENDLVIGDEYLEELIRQGLEVFKEETGGEITQRQSELLESREFAKLDNLLRTRSSNFGGAVLLQNTVNGEIYYMSVNDYDRLRNQLNEGGVFPIGEQFDQTIDNPFQNPPTTDLSNLEASSFSDITTADILRENMIELSYNIENVFEKIGSKLFDFTPPRKSKKTIRIPIDIPGGESTSSFANNMDFDVSVINNNDLNIKLKDLYRSTRE